MKKLLLVIAAVAMLLPSCQKINEAIDGLDNRLDKLEQETIPSIDEQISAINTTLGNLDAMDKELKGYIDNLTTTASSLQEQINAANAKIEEVKTALQSEISTAKSEVLAQLATAKTELENELAQINSTIETLKAKDTELDNKITELRFYVDTELGDTTDWVNATFATLEQYNALVSEVATIKEQIKAINQSITNLETRLTTKINEDIANAVSTLNADIQQKVSEITSAYTNAVKTAKEEITTAYTTAIQNAINALDVSLKAWVGEQLANYYTIAEVEAKITALNNSITNGDADLQQELNTLKEQLTNTANEITAAYKKAIEEAITTNNGEINTKIANEIASVNQRITNEVATINAKIAEIESRLDNVEAKIAELLARIQSVSYIPTYSDGKATVKYSGGASQVELDFKISPKECVAELEKIWKEVLKVEAVYTQTRAVSFIELQIVKCDVDTATGVLSIVASCSNLSTEFFAGTQEASAALVISDGNNSVTSDYVPMTAKEVSDEELEDDILSSIPKNQIWYTTKDDSKLFPNTTDVTTFGAVLTSNVYKNGKGILTFDDNVTKIGNEVFKGCSSLTSITIPDSVTTIGSSAFSGCSGLTSLTIPDSVTTIESAAFSGCTGELIVNCNIPSASSYFYGALYNSKFTKVTIGDSVTTIGRYAFYNSSSLTTITIGNGVTSIGDWAFYDCSSLTSITIPDSVTTIGNYAFGYCGSMYEFKGRFASNDGRYLINNGKLIAYAPFGLTEYIIPDSVTSIGSYAFIGCSSLTSITIPESVTSIESYAFYDCSSLTSITIPDSVTSIESAAFSCCSSLTSVYCKSVTPPTGVYSMFLSNATGRTIYVPSNSVSAYKSASGWSDYADYIEGYDFATDETLQPANNEIWYTNGSTTEATIPYETDAFGANIVSNTYDAEKECWVIKFDGNVTKISYRAFYYCSSLTSVTIPDSVTTIGDYAFRDCTSLTSVNIPDSVTSIGDCAFYDCTSLTSVTIPDSVTTIGSSTFLRCTSLTSVTIPDSVTTIGYYAFQDCSSLTSVTIPDSVTTIRDCAFQDCSMLQEFKGKFASDDGRCLIQDGTLIAFAPEGLTEYAIPDSVTTIGSSAFEGCSSLTSVTIPDSVTSIGSRAFYECTSLESVTIPDSVTSIGNYAFEGCTSLTSVTIGNGVTSIGYYAFDNCTSLTSVTIPDSVTSIGSDAFQDCTSLTSVTIGNGVTTIGYYAFEGCTSLTSVTIPDSVTTIRDDAFHNCTSLTSVTIPDSVTSIGDDAFGYCTSLISVTIPDSVTSIGDYAFYGCLSLKEVYCKPTTPPTGGSSMFTYNVSGRKIYVPSNSVSAYKSASGWSDYSDKIFGYNFENNII